MCIISKPSIIWIGVTYRKRSSRSQIVSFSPRVTLHFNRWPWKIKEHLTNATSSSVHHYVAICEFKLELQYRNAQLRSLSAIFCPAWPWNLTDDLGKQQGTSSMLIRLCSSFCHHLWILTEVTVRKCPNWGKICFDLCNLDRWPCPFARTTLSSMVITPENFMMLLWQEHSE